MTLPAINIDEAMADRQLLGAVLKDMETWRTWQVALKAAFGIKLTDEELLAFTAIAGDRKPPEHRVQQFWAIVGRRGGKTRMAALICTYLATCIDHRAYLSPGERGHVLCLAPTQRVAAGVLEYCRAFLEASPILRQEIEGVTADEIRLRGNVSISVHPANYRTVRGRTLIAVVMDETAQWRDEMSALPDVEALRAVVPALLTTKGMVVGISTPYGQRGLLFERYRDCFGKDDEEVLVVKGSSTEFNPTLDEKQIERDLARDPEANRAEYLSEFRSDLSAFISKEALEQCVEVDRQERPFQTRYRYCGFVDPSGGQHDSFCLGISHKEGDRVVLDLVLEEKAPFDPQEVVSDFVKELRKYRINVVTGDAYASNWCSGAFRDHGIRYQPADRDKSQIMLDALPLLTSGNAVLLDNRRLLSQIQQLQRETGRGGRDRVVKMRGGYDDLANAALGSLVYAQERSPQRHARRPYGYQQISPGVWQ